MPEEKRTDDLVEELLSQEKSLGSRKQTLIDDLLKQREAAVALFDEKLAKLGYHANSNHAPQPGDKMPDGTIFAGISPDTGRAMYAMPADASLTMTFNGAKEYAQGLNAKKAHGRDDWHVPTKNELNVLFNNLAAIGGFDLSGSSPAGWYWSARPGHTYFEWVQRFSDGQGYNFNDGRASVRCVR